MKKFRVLLLTFVVAVTMMAGSLSVFAVQGDTSKASATVPTLTKEVTLAEGVTMPLTAFEFTATLTSNADQVDTPAGAPQSFVTTVSGAQTVGDGNAKTFTGALNVPDTWAVGEYTYEITETAPTQTTGKTGWTKIDTAKYYLHVYAKNDNTVLYSITKTNAVNAEKVPDAEFKFSNEYENNNGELTVSKTVDHPEYVPADTEYEFTITFTENGSAKVPATITGKIGEGESAKTVTVTNGSGTFKLKKDESVKFTDLPVGLKYQVVEEEPSHASYKETSITVNGTAVDGGGRDTGVNKITETANTAAYTNVYDEVTITGVIMNVLPFVMMIAIAGAAAAMYVVSRRRKMAR
jgi:hypothetical protein